MIDEPALIAALTERHHRRRRPRCLRPGAAAGRQPAVPAEERGADAAFRRPDLGQPAGAVPQRLRQLPAGGAGREAALGDPRTGGLDRAAARRTGAPGRRIAAEAPRPDRPVRPSGGAARRPRGPLPPGRRMRRPLGPSPVCAGTASRFPHRRRVPWRIPGHGRIATLAPTSPDFRLNSFVASRLFVYSLLFQGNR